MGSALRLTAVAVLAALWGCFSAPSADVLFACDPQNAPQCPPDYSCEADGCCHRNGSDVQASAGACNSAGTSGFDPSGTDTDTDTDTGDTDTGDTDPSDTDTDTGSEGDTDDASTTLADTDATGDGPTTGR